MSQCVMCTYGCWCKNEEILHIFFQNTCSRKRHLLNVLFVILLGFLSFVVRGVLFIELYTVYNNFGKGLRERGNACLHVVDYCKTNSP